MKTFQAFGIALLLAAAFVLAGCAELRDDLPTPTGTAGKVHPAGWSDTASGNFHGHAIRNANWDMSQCQTCHGTNHAGGTVNVSCLTCHSESGGPENCSNCHGNVNPAPPNDTRRNWNRGAPGVGAHQIHLLGSSMAAPFLCSECHTVPGSVRTPGHIDSAGSRAEVQFNLRLARTVSNEPTTQFYTSGRPTITPEPVHDAALLTCASTYCHGNFKNGNPANTPVWNDTTGSAAACGTCHGDVTRTTIVERALPKTDAQGGSHPNSTSCNTCHGQVVDATGKIISASRHVNGLLNVFNTERDF